MALNIYVRVGESGVSTVMPLFRIFAVKMDDARGLM